MALVRMDYLTVVGMQADRDAVVDALMRAGAVQIDEPDPRIGPADIGEAGPDGGERATLARKTSGGSANPTAIALAPTAPGTSGSANPTATALAPTAPGTSGSANPPATVLAPVAPGTSGSALTEQQAAGAETSRILTDLARLERVIDLAHRRHPEKKSLFKSLRQVPANAFMEVGARADAILGRVDRIEGALTRITELRSQQTRRSMLCELLEPWIDLPVDLAERATVSAELFLGTLNNRQKIDGLEAALRDEAPASVLRVLNAGQNRPRIVLAVWRPSAAAASGVLRRFGFNPLPLTGESGTAAEQLNRLSQASTEAEAESQELERSLDADSAPAVDFEMLYDYLNMRLERHAAAGKLACTASTFVLTGWVPSRLALSVRRALSSRFTVATASRPAAKDDAYPILLRNHALIRPFEAVVEMFSAPNIREVDPTPVLAPFFFIFFGLMFSDVGYGLLLALGSGLTLWKLKPGPSSSRLLRMLFLCSLSSIVWGFAFGSFFGDMISVLSQGRLAFPLLWFDPLKDPIRLMIWSMVFGVIHLFAAMAVRIYILIRSGAWLDALLDVVPWYAIIVGLGLMVAGVGDPASKWLAIGGAAVVLLFAGRSSKNVIARLGSGLWALYGITGYFGDILSYSRILALVLATSVIAMVFNLLGFLNGPTVIGILMFILVATAGHLLNLALSALSSYVHTSRLHYVEFFGKFYEGGGRLWRPLGLNTRYVAPVRDDTADREQAGQGAKAPSRL